MRLIKIVRLRIRSLFLRNRVESELDEEIRYHLNRGIEESVRAGSPPDEARRAAGREFGPAGRVAEECRDARRTRVIPELWQDLVYGWRLLAGSPGFAAVAIVTLALGVGANSAIFSVIDAVLLRPLPFAQSERLVRVYTTAFGGALTKVTSARDCADWRNESQSFEDLAIYRQDGNTLMGLGDARRIDSVSTGPDFFNVFMVDPLIGRTFS
ncbi:MAG TPA: permease prefix domain 1-containing protein, partial [Blastocatellia bacterium]